MGLFSFLIQYVAPIFIITSPLTSYGDQIRSIYTTRTSRGFSLDTPLIMLVASILRCFYWLGADFDKSLLAQSALMICVQLTLLKAALDHRPAEPTVPFQAERDEREGKGGGPRRPGEFWQWREQRPYWEFLSYFTLAAAALQVCFGARPPFVDALGYLALGIEALLPLPQVLANQRRRSCEGFRVSVLASWLIGDAMKMVFFANALHVGLQFKLCAAVQTAFDAYLGMQFWWFGNGNGNGNGKKGEEGLEKSSRRVSRGGGSNELSEL